MSETEQNSEPILDTKPKPFVFVLMPFAKGYDDVYHLGIKAASDKAGAYAERLDEQMFKESMLQRIHNQIAKADVIVADMTGRNPNVFYEVGYAHALGKVVILLTQKGDDIPFDLKHYRHIVYENVMGLLPQLEIAVEWAVQRASKKRQPVMPISICCNRQRLVNKPTIAVPLASQDYRRETYEGFELPLTFENLDTIHSTLFNVALWTSATIDQCRWEGCWLSPARHPGGAHIFNCPEYVSLLPRQCVGHEVFLGNPAHQVRRSGLLSVLLQVLTESGSYDYEFNVDEFGQSGKQ
jgi:hypothetical protein